MSSASGECDFGLEQVSLDSARMKIRKSRKRRDVTQQELQHISDDCLADNEMGRGSIECVLQEQDSSSDSFDSRGYHYHEPRVVRRGKNNSFSDFQVREIERRNAVLINKIDSYNRKPSEYSKTGKECFTKVSNSQVNRKKKQTQIERENMILLKKIQSVKPFGLSKRK